MKFTKRITSLLLVFVLVSASLFTYVQAADFSDVADTNAFANAISELVGAGVINGYEDGTFKPDATITRAEFAKILAVAAAPMGYQFTAVSTTFSDIPDMNADHGWAVPYIAYAVSTKAVNGYTDGTFQPGNPVTYGEAIKMLVCTLGYGPVVDTTLTPWYQGYLNIANQIGLSKGAVSMGDTPASRGIVAQATYNMLGCAPLVQTGVDENGNPVYAAGGDTFDDEKGNTTSGEGILMGVTEFSLSDKVVGRSQVQIDDEIYQIGSLDMEALKADMGKRVSYSYNGTGSKKELVRVIPVSSLNEEIAIDAEMLESINASGLEYYADEAAERKGTVTKISFQSAPYIIYNGKPVRPADVNTVITGHISGMDAGSIKVISNDGTISSGEVLVVDKYVTYFANAPLTEDDKLTIFDKNVGVTSLPNVELYEDEYTVQSVKSMNAKPATAGSGVIQNETVVSIAQPYGTTKGTNVIVSTIKVTGDVTELASGYDYVKIGSTRYELSPYYRKLMNSDPTTYEFQNGDNATFYIDYLGRIVFMKKNVKSDPYGLVLEYSNNVGGLEGSDALKILTAEGRVIEPSLKQNVTVNGSQISSSSAISALAGARTVTGDNMVAVPVVYKLVGGQVSAFEILSPAIAKASLDYTLSGRSFKDDGGNTKFTMLTGTDAAEVFVIPVAGSITDSSKYSNTTASFFKDDTTYDVAAYEMTGTNAKIVLCYLTGTQSSKQEIVPSTPVYIVKSFVGIANDAKRVTFQNIFTGEEPTGESGDDAAVNTVVNNLKVGDLVKYVADDSGVISDIKLVFSINESKIKEGTGDYVPSSAEGHYIKKTGNGDPEYFQAIYGTIYDFNDEQVQVIPAIYTSTALNAGEVVNLSASGAQYYQVTKDGNNNIVISAAAQGSMLKYIDFKDTAPASATKAVVISLNGKTAVYIDKR